MESGLYGEKGKIIFSFYKSLKSNDFERTLGLFYEELKKRYGQILQFNSVHQKDLEILRYCKTKDDAYLAACATT